MDIRKININCDLGEGMEWEDLIFPYIQSCSIACGGHFGNVESIHKTMVNAIEHKVLLGAHPSYPDRINFGRKSIPLQPSKFQESIEHQLSLYFSVLENFKVKNNHVKAHGALYNDLLRDLELSERYLEVLCEFGIEKIFTPDGSALVQVALKKGISVEYEAFLDRNYQANGQLVARKHLHAMKSSPEEVWDQLKGLIEKQQVIAENGIFIPMKANTFCVHGDHVEVLEILRFVQQQLNHSNDEDI